MGIFNYLYFQHDPWLLASVTLMCGLSAFISIKLFQRAISESGTARLHWIFLSATTGGGTIWATHFIAMIGHDPGVPVTLNGTKTVGSALIAIAGTALAIFLAGARGRAKAALLGGGALGLTSAGVHYSGMLGYQAEGVIVWRHEYVIGSIIAGVLFSIYAIERLRRGGKHSHLWSSQSFAAAILALHFVGMAGFIVTPLFGAHTAMDHEALAAFGGAIVLVTLLIICTSLSTYLVESNVVSRSQEQLRHIALHDPLTGLANRRHFNEALRNACIGLNVSGGSFAMLLVDLDRFKAVNDTLGHPVGDKLLEKVAHRLRRAVRDGDFVARTGGDEFAIIAYDITDIATANQIAERAVDLLGQNFLIDGAIVEIGASIGTVIAPEDGTDAEHLTINADLALYAAKRAGRGQACRFEPQLSEAIVQRRALEFDLRRATMREDFHLVYQPVREAGRARFIGAEALVRWNCPKRGSVPPSDFIPLAEELGLISRIGAFVLRQACKDAAKWADDLTIAVNLSAVQLLDPNLPQIVSQALAESGLAPGRLELEITETALLGNDELALHSVRELRKLGVSVSLDDFGTGYSSLSYLHRFPIDRIKIDKSFVQRLPVDESSASIVRAIAQLGASLNMKITAEGIESAEQLSVISEYGCDHVQGFLIGHPVSIDELVKLFNNAPGRIAA